MSEPYYTLTIHIAEGGTPQKIPSERPEDKGRVLWAGETSGPGHMWYSIQKVDGQDKTVNSFGFAPENGKSGSGSVPGKVFDTDSKIYHEPLYERTLQINEATYKSLMNFGANAKDGKWVPDFNSKYHSLHNSCVDFTGRRWSTPGLRPMVSKEI